jgi:hypothetical protein
LPMIGQRRLLEMCERATRHLPLSHVEQTPIIVSPNAVQTGPRREA